MTTTDQLWHDALKQIEAQIGKQNFTAWIKRVRFNSRSGNQICLDVPDRFTRDWLVDNYLPLFEEVLSFIARAQMKVRFNICSDGTGDEPSHLPAKKQEQKHKEQPDRSNNLIPKYTFENFVVGASNQFAQAASMAVANQPGEHYNPLFIYGGVGLGKTHLVNAIGHRAASRRAGLKILYLSSESFMNELIGSLRRDKMDEFKTKFRNIDILILDDVQFIAGKERTQEEFFHTFNSLYESHKQIVITSDKFPKDIPGLEDRLRNRFEWGLIADIQPPDVETRVAIVAKKAEAEGFNLPDEVALFIASNIDSNVRELEGSLTRLGAYASLTKSEITLDLTKQVLQNNLKTNKRDITVESIQRTICEYYMIKPSDLRAKRRTQDVALPRQVAMYLCRKLTGISYPVIGTLFGGRDHSTVIHASKAIEKRLKEDPNMQTAIDTIEKNLHLKN
ncbi:MAG TPA: chromosomal replication initiator protein DnaA [Candidatus Binatia bacterium]|jgi:chromosomal replication initiator protein